MQQLSLDFEFVIILKGKTLNKLLRFYFFCYREFYLVCGVLFEGWGLWGFLGCLGFSGCFLLT